MAYDKLTDFQKNLSEDNEAQSCFISGSEIKTPERKKPRTDEKIYKSTEQMFMEKLELQYKKLSCMQKKLYNLRNENNIEEVRSRYLKLELNNSQVENQELRSYKRKFICLLASNIGIGLSVCIAMACRIYTP
jgi:hypothetical protein